MRSSDRSNELDSTFTRSLAGEEGELDARGWGRELSARGLVALDHAALVRNEGLSSGAKLLWICASAAGGG
jgi:hypothetical protein